MKNRGPKQKYDEETVMVSFRCPISKFSEFRKFCNTKLDEWKTKKSNIFKVSDQDQSIFDNRKYCIKKIKKVIHIFRVANGAKGKFNVLLAQDILGILCEVKFIDGDTLNCTRENLKAINKDVEFIY